MSASRSGAPVKDRRPTRRGTASKPAHKVKRFSTTDKVVLTLMVVGPLALEAVLIWFPTILSVGLSFTRWNGLGDLSTIESAGWANYDYVFTDYPPFWPAVVHNVIWLVFLGAIATPLGILFAVLLDKRSVFRASTKASSFCRSCSRSLSSASFGS